ncbi:KilA-N domain-containing protein [Acinetobacter nosocomialis]|uniref:KilA-N domain-containing protein n=1 Tax=Acinetobacter nosocomialis TaxID=106654 RepID=UPI00126A590D|nr:KilA-N domain-containing protein [Acinetobacter nosocomialis]
MTSLAQNFLNPNNKPLVIGDFTIRQDEDGRYCLHDLHKASGALEKHQPAFFMRNKQTKDLIEEIENSANLQSSENDRSANLQIAVKVIKGGAGEQGTYVVKELVYAYAMWISPKFHLMVIRAYDSLVMEWVLNGKQTISPEQAGVLYNIVHTRANGNKNLIVQMWSRLKNHFKYSASYRELRTIHFEDAKHYLEVMDLNAKPEKHDSHDVVAQLDEYLKNLNSRYPALKCPYAYEAAMKIADDMSYRDAKKPQSYYVSFQNGRVITRWLEERFYPVDMIELSEIFDKFLTFSRSNDLLDIGRNLKENISS